MPGRIAFDDQAVSLCLEARVRIGVVEDLEDETLNCTAFMAVSGV